MAATAYVEKTALLDTATKDIFDWSDDATPLRDAMWDKVMESNNHNTDKTSEQAAKWEDMNDSDLKAAAEKLLK
ncbi:MULTISPECIES: P8 family protein [Pediococcus]|uniref:Uncharacterized protein n=2 Tax=Pediococcus TaxID=1253 RepID=A0A0R2IVK6_9LACO|nr:MULTISPECIES: hypothetical protein [Pediococcus]KRN66236.1 hypothetical protein IV80_GL001486 [Pediococcus cellicola]KRN81499.1 hypothetical protein IV87_GL001137 [Pediococcus ethanolidurans]MBU7554830.1 hypothetical protein [Pediococcus ethanolidurans]MBU7563203.1 hypothetical protein [Pediococcus ethanolidurans]MCT4398541.1 hypothetical protein [Pediococcus ethanolidurans]